LSPAYAQHEKENEKEAKPEKQAAQEQRPQQPQAQRSEQGQQQQPQRTRQQAVAWQQHGGWQGHSTWQPDRAQHWDRDHRTWAQRGGYGGYYIPEAQFDLDFGMGLGSGCTASPRSTMGYPRFSYGGFSFLLVDPYPESWAENWYDTDDLYIGYDNGYYLYDRRYPSMALAITVAL